MRELSEQKKQLKSMIGDWANMAVKFRAVLMELRQSQAPSMGQCWGVRWSAARYVQSVFNLKVKIFILRRHLRSACLRGGGGASITCVLLHSISPAINGAPLG